MALMDLSITLFVLCAAKKNTPNANAKEMVINKNLFGDFIISPLSINSFK